MSSDITLSSSDEGKSVVDADGKTIGKVVEVQGGDAHVDPDPNIADTVMSKLGWGDSDEETYRLDASEVQEVTEDEIRLGSF